MRLKKQYKRRSAFMCVSAGVLLLLFNHVAGAADMAGRYLVSGIGKDSCRSFVDANEVGKSYYRTWLSGYISSYNFHTEDTYSIVNKQTVGELEAWLHEYCLVNSTYVFEQAAKNLMRKLNYFRQKNFYDR